MPKSKKRFSPKVFKTLFPKIKLDDVGDPRVHLGKMVLAQKTLDSPFEEVKVNSILGNIKHLKHFEINGTHLVSMFSFFTQMDEGRLPTKEEEAEFELASDVKDIREIK